jgi:hypothetical protein
MPQYDTPLLVKQIAGYAGRNPEIKEGSKGEFVSFSMGVSRSYGDDDDSTLWYRIAVNDPQVQNFVMTKVRKGTPIVLEGSEYETEYQGTKQLNLNAYRVGLVDWFVKGAPSAREPLARTPARAVEDEDL